MAIAFVFFFLALLDVSIYSAECVPKHVHEVMTKREIVETFGTDYIPDYQVVAVTLPGARKRRQANNGFQMKIDLKGKPKIFTFKQVPPYLASKNTPVWMARTDKNAYRNVSFEPLETAIRDCGRFAMYHDLPNEGAVVVFTDPDHEAIIEGIITGNYAIKSLPKRLMRQPIKVGDGYMVESPILQKRSIIDPDADEVTGHYIVFRSASMPDGAHYDRVLDRVRRQRGRRPPPPPAIRPNKVMPGALYPEILLVVEYNALRNQSLTQVLRFMIAFWNGVDMAYSSLDRPKVRLTIAGIIVSGDDAATPYIAKNTTIDLLGRSQKILWDMTTSFSKEAVRFPVKTYDIIIAMTRIILCEGATDPCFVLLGFANFEGACRFRSRHPEMKNDLKGSGIVYYNFDYGGVKTAAHEAAHLFGVDHDEGEGLSRGCHASEGYTMAPSAEHDKKGFQWSKCSKDFFQRYFRTAESMCLDNQPRWMKPVKEVLGGRWLSLDGQCLNAGFEKACQVPKYPICMLKGCNHFGSNACIISELAPLQGSKCAENKHCNSGSSCVPD